MVFEADEGPRTMVFEEMPLPLGAQEHKFSSTAVVELDSAPPSLPFENRAKPARGAVVEAPPGSPWAKPSASHPPVDIQDDKTLPVLEGEDPILEEKIREIVEPKAMAPVDVPVSIPASSLRRAEDSKRKKVSSVWREDPPEARAPKPAATPVAPVPPPPKTDLSRQLYRKAKRT